MKKVGIIFAMKEEMDALKEYLDITREYEIYDLKFYEGNINNVTCVLVECGVGKVNAARTTQVLIDKMNVDYVFNIGVAGGISKELNVLDIVIGEKLVQHDFDITEFDHEKGYIPNVGVYIESDSYLVNLAKSSEVKNIKVGNRNISNETIIELCKKYNYHKENYIINPVIGEYDNPANQSQHLLTLPLSKE